MTKHDECSIIPCFIRSLLKRLRTLDVAKLPTNSLQTAEEKGRENEGVGVVGETLYLLALEEK
jgi:hypothetical protein